MMENGKMENGMEWENILFLLMINNTKVGRVDLRMENLKEKAN
jgi:hypothetical protein